jgi:uncharacterized protein
MINRDLESQIRPLLGNGKVQLLYGPRRVGKTTLARKLFEGLEYLYLDCDQTDVRGRLEPKSLKSLESLVGDYKNIIIDEAQRLDDAGLTLKIMIDAHPEWTIIATGSTSLDLRGMIREPLTGRANEHTLLPVTSSELLANGLYNSTNIHTAYERLMVYGGYPASLAMSEKDAGTSLLDIAEKYVFRDALTDVDLRQRGVLESLLYALAAMCGGEVSYQRLANDLDISSQTVQRYMYLLEQAFVIYTLQVGKGGIYNLSSRRKRKVYFCDLGIRNAIMKNFTPISPRQDNGALWENLCVSEIQQAYGKKQGIFTYWRSNTSEVDLLVRSGGKDYAYEFKLVVGRTVRAAKAFVAAYSGVDIKVVSSDNLSQTLTDITTEIR